MSDNPVRSIAIAGGGSAAWSAAAVLAQALQSQDISITVLDTGPSPFDSPAESTLPQSLTLHRFLGLDERDLMKIARATFRLGTEYLDWWGEGDRYFQPLGLHGAGIDFIAFHHLLIRQQLAGEPMDMDAYSLCAMAAGKGKFTHPSEDGDSILSTLAYGLHLDGAWYVRYIRGFAEHNGTQRIEGRIADVRLRGEDGFIEALLLEDGRELAADLFIDCTDEARLIDGGLAVAFEDWSHWLPADRAVMAYSPPQPEPPPCTTLRAFEDGWLRQVPLGDKLVSEFLFNAGISSAEDAIDRVTAMTGPQVQVEPAARQLVHGRRRHFWRHNCIALGPAAGGLEPLPMGSQHLAQTGVMRLLNLLPDRSCNPLLAGEYNRLTGLEYANLRDYQITHYQATHRDSPFWKLTADSELPETLQRKLRVFASQGQVPYYDEETFENDAWAAMLLGQKRWPSGYNRCLDEVEQDRIDARFEQMRDLIRQAADRMPPHGPYIGDYLGAGP